MYFKNQTAGLGLLAVLVVTCTCNSPSVVEAIKENNTLELTRHLKHGVSPNATLPDGNGRYSGWPLLAVACSEGNVDIARLLIQAGAEVNEMVGDSYVFPLGLAIHQKNR